MSSLSVKKVWTFAKDGRIIGKEKLYFKENQKLLSEGITCNRRNGLFTVRVIKPLSTHFDFESNSYGAYIKMTRSFDILLMSS